MPWWVDSQPWIPLDVTSQLIHDCGAENDHPKSLSGGFRGVYRWCFSDTPWLNVVFWMFSNMYLWNLILILLIYQIRFVAYFQAQTTRSYFSRSVQSLLFKTANCCFAMTCRLYSWSSFLRLDFMQLAGSIPCGSVIRVQSRWRYSHDTTYRVVKRLGQRHRNMNVLEVFLESLRRPPETSKDPIWLHGSFIVLCYGRWVQSQ